jgi:protein-S-isoprenylcysteine O-methyltransferase Ste14
VFDSIDDLLFFSFFFVLLFWWCFFFHVILGKEKVLKGVFKKYVNSVSSAHTGAVTY